MRIHIHYIEFYYLLIPKTASGIRSTNMSQNHLDKDQNETLSIALIFVKKTDYEIKDIWLTIG